MSRFAIVFAALALIAAPAAAQELSLLAGRMRADVPDAGSYAWLLSYSHDLSEHWAASFAWQNEGHVPDHHRDGASGQLWAKTSLFDPRLVFAAGAGPYYYFDTTGGTQSGGYRNDHGWGVLYSASVAWRASARLRYVARLGHVETRRSIDTTDLLIGLGWTLDAEEAKPRESGARTASPERDEATVFAGRTIVNSLESEGALAKAVELRHAFGPVLRGTLAWIDEGDTRVAGRHGVAAQAWLEPGFSGDSVTLGVGLGAYFAEDRLAGGDDRTSVSPIVTMTASARLGGSWAARVSWNRVVSRYDRDSDVVVLGVGVRFGA
jgi:hypothetical protein